MSRKQKPQLPVTSPKQVRTSQQAIPQQKQVRGVDNALDNSLKPLWSLSALDIGSEWCWTKITSNIHATVLKKLGDFESMTWQELRNAGCHSVDVQDIIKAAKDRLQEIGKDDISELYSLRITGVVRVWAIKERSVLRLLWLDRNHEVYPSHKKHT